MAALPPVLSAVLLGAMLARGPVAPFRQSPEVQGYFDRVAAQIEGIPHQQGDWLGIDIPPTPAAVDLLQPNKLMQRRYTHAETGAWFDLLIVHCGDVRDMIGHYPPVCYPAHGWKLGEKTTLPVRIAEVDAQAAEYRFSREQGLSTDSIRVTNFFALPAPKGPSFGPELTLIERAGQFRETARLGSAQVQVITESAMGEAEHREAVETALTLVNDVLLLIEGGLQ